nr:hypothetical protein [Quadrisphaera setariae]
MDMRSLLEKLFGRKASSRIDQSAGLANLWSLIVGQQEGTLLSELFSCSISLACGDKKQRHNKGVPKSRAQQDNTVRIVSICPQEYGENKGQHGSSYCEDGDDPQEWICGLVPCVPGLFA